MSTTFDPSSRSRAPVLFLLRGRRRLRSGSCPSEKPRLAPCRAPSESTRSPPAMRPARLQPLRLLCSFGSPLVSIARFQFLNLGDRFRLFLAIWHFIPDRQRPLDRTSTRLNSSH